MKFQHIVLYTACALALLAALSGCKSTRQATPRADSADNRQITVVEPEPASEISRIAASYTPWTDLTVPVKVSMTKPKKMSVSGTMTMAYGKAVSIKLRMLFIEVATVYIDNESITAVSGPAGIYYTETMERFTAATGLDLRDIQSLLLGQAFAPGKGTLTIADAPLFTVADSDISVEGATGITLTPKKQSKNISLIFNALVPDAALEASPQIYGVDINAGANRLKCTYASPEITKAGLTAAAMQIEGSVKKRSLDVVISRTAEKAKWNTGASISKPSIPSGASRVTTEQLLKKI